VIVVDTGVLVAAINRRDKFHESCADFLVTAAEPLVVPTMVITEVCYLLARRGRGTPQLAAAFLESLAAGELDVEAPTTADFDRAAQLVRRYADLRSTQSTPRWSLQRNAWAHARSRRSTARTSRSSFPATATPSSFCPRPSANVRAPRRTPSLTGAHKTASRSQTGCRTPCAIQGWYRSCRRRIRPLTSIFR